jgi:hypothetical protein
VNRFIILSIGQSQEENPNGFKSWTQARFEVSQAESALGKSPEKPSIVAIVDRSNV